MSKLLRNRWLHRALFVGALIALGVGIYRVTPPEAMCVFAEAQGNPVCFADGGRLLVTLRPHGGWGDLIQRGPVVVSDTRTGTEIGRYFDRKRIHWRDFSRDGRYCAAVIGEAPPPGRLAAPPLPERYKKTETLLVDLGAGKTSRLFTLDGPSIEHWTIFAPSGDVVAGWLEDGMATFESATGRRLAGFGRGQKPYSSRAFFAGEKIVLERTVDTSRPGLDLRDPRDGKLLACLDNAILASGQAVDDRFLIARRLRKDKSLSDRWLICNSQTLDVEGEFQAPGPNAVIKRPPGAGHFLVCEDPNDANGRVEVRELPTGKRIGKENAQAAALSPDGRFLLLAASAPRRVLQMIELPAMKLLWTKNRNDSGIEFHFSADSGTAYAIQEDPCELLAVDSQTGELRKHISFPSVRLGRGTPPARPTPDRRSLLVHEAAHEVDQPSFWARLAKWVPWLKWQPRNDITLVLDADTCRERFSLRGWNASVPMLSADGNTLVTVHDEPGDRVLRCWDVNAWKPLHGALGVPAGLGAVVMGLAWWRRRQAGVRQRILAP